MSLGDGIGRALNYVNETSDAWERFDANAWTDDWCDLCDAVGIDYSAEDLNARALRKCVRNWAGADAKRWQRILDAPPD